MALNLVWPCAWSHKDLPLKFLTFPIRGSGFDKNSHNLQLCSTLLCILFWSSWECKYSEVCKNAPSYLNKCLPWWVWELDYNESWAPKNWCFWTVVLEKALQSPLDCKEIQPVHPKGNQSWVFIGRTDIEVETPILWPPDAKSWLIWKDPDASQDWRREGKGMTEDEIIGRHYQLNGHEFE